METNTIIRTEDSINMGGSFLNETQVRDAGLLVSNDPDIKSELHGDITAVMCILQSYILTSASSALQGVLTRHYHYNPFIVSRCSACPDVCTTAAPTPCATPRCSTRGWTPRR